MIKSAAEDFLLTGDRSAGRSWDVVSYEGDPGSDDSMTEFESGDGRVGCWE